MQLVVLAAGEFLLCLAASLLAMGGFSLDGIQTEYPAALAVALMLSVSLAAVGLYSAHQRAEWKGLGVRLLIAVGVAFSALVLLNTLFPVLGFSFTQIGTGLTASLATLVVTRILFYRYIDAAMMVRRVMVLGSGEKARSIEQLRRRADQRGFHVIAFVKPPGGGEVKVDPSRVLSSTVGICSYALKHDVDEIVVALDDRRQGAVPTSELLNCRMSGIDVTHLLDFFERETGKIRLDLLQPGWLIHADGFKRHILRDASKRFFDIFFSVVLLGITSPVMLLTALAILVESRGKGSILYRQKRVGRGGKVFELIKFRSMRMDAEGDGKAKWASESDPRITRVGRIIRKYRIDELPQLWNILRNEMSIVGPRPERPEFVARLNGVNPLYKERHRVKPGLAGWAQLRYPYGASDEDAIEKLQYDLYYVKNHRVLFDLYILVQTVEVVLFGKGAR
ncbi:MAG: TIGR03013 family PEP-CTERM/XrtA system glycosyltransferase [Gammaproteobacteria bacterium]|nr:MAG: TIGR03013 family PEP-CTERM/XrtA system glycosyltransferase [Gammaproteobacteria bacterium]